MVYGSGKMTNYYHLVAKRLDDQNIDLTTGVDDAKTVVEPRWETSFSKIMACNQEGTTPSTMATSGHSL